MSDFRKPRADNPILPTTALFRKVKKTPKIPKGRKGKLNNRKDKYNYRWKILEIEDKIEQDNYR